MRITNWCTSALGLAAFLQSAVAQSTVQTTFTTTYYLERVKATPAPTSAPPGMILYNTTGTGHGTASAGPTPSSSGLPAAVTGAASAIGVDRMGFAAVAGLVGLAVL